MSDFINDIDKIVNDRVINMWDNMERRDYYELEDERPEFYRNRGERNGIMYLGDVDWDHYADIHVYKDNSFKMAFRRNDTNIISIQSENFKNENIKTLLKLFIESIDEYLKLMNIFNSLKKGVIPTDILRNNKIDNILENDI